MGTLGSVWFKNTNIFLWTGLKTGDVVTSPVLRNVLFVSLSVRSWLSSDAAAAACRRRPAGCRPATY